MPRLADLAGGPKVLRPVGGCRTCPRKLKDFVHATLKETQIIVVGEAPGAVEVEKGEGFRGRSGTYLRETFHRHGITEFSVSNIIHCRPPNNRTPNQKEISACLAQYSLREIRGYPLVVLTGGTPCRAIFPGANYSHLRGNLIYHPDFPGQRFFVTYHPAYAIRSPEGAEAFNKQVERLGRIVRGETEQYTIHPAKGAAFVAALQETLREPLISLDIETDRLESWDLDSDILSFAVAVREDEALFVHKDEPHWVASMEALKDALLVPEKKVLGHNIGFDLVWLEDYLQIKTRCKWIFDTQVLFYQLKGWISPSLKQLVGTYLDGYRHLLFQPHKCTDAELMRWYNAEDVIQTLRLHLKYTRDLGPKQLDLYLNVAGPASVTTRRMTHTGIYFHQDRWRQAQDQLRQQRVEALEAWRVADPRFNPTVHTTGKGFETYLLDVCQYQPVSLTKTGKPSWDAAALKQLIRKQGASQLEHTLVMREIDKTLSTFVDPYEGHIAIDGRVHSNYNNTVTITGRLSSSNPNQQNIPRRSLIRNFYGAGPGMEFMEADFSQIELRVGFSLAGDELAIQNYNAGHDQHELTAQILTGKTVITKEDRTNAKAVNFGLIYGGGWRMVQAYALDTYGVVLSDLQSQQFVKAFFRQFISLGNWHRDSILDLRMNHGFVESAVGHVHKWDDWNSDNDGKRSHAERSSINMRCQGPAAYMMNYLQVLCSRGFVEMDIPAAFVGNVHDSMLIEYEDGRRDEIIQMIELMKVRVHAWAQPWFKVPLVLDYKVGTHWGELTELPPIGHV